MKNTTYLSLLAVAALASLASCSSEDIPDVPAADDVETFTITMPSELGSRAFDSGLKATNLYVAVYPQGSTEAAIISNFKDGANPTAVKTQGFNGSSLSTTVTIPLVKDMEYDVVFWAESYTDGAADDPYSFDSASRSIKVDYSKMPLDSEEADAFYAQVSIKSAGTVHNVTLTRPFAQINVGTADLQQAAAAGKAVTKAGLTFSQLDNTFNLATSQASGSDENVTFPVTPLPASADYPFPVAGYDYLAMAYVLVGYGTGDKASISDIALTLNDDTKPFATYTNIPAQRNFRTNIYGALLTNPEVFNVTINPAFEGTFTADVKAETADDLAQALQSPAASVIEIPQSIDASSLTKEQLTFTAPKTLKMADGAVLTLPANATIEANASLTLQGGTLKNTAGSSTAAADDGSLSLINIHKGSLKIDGTTIVNNPDYHYHGNQRNSSAITYYGEVDSVTITDANVSSGMFALCGMNRGANNAVVNIKNSTLSSTSSVHDNGVNWAYAVRLFGKTAVLDNCTVYGIQGALSTDSGVQCTINGGNYYTYNTEGQTDAFYAVYATSNSTVTVNGGYFYSPNKRTSLDIEGTSCLVSGNNDVNLPDGTFILNTCNLSGKPYNTTGAGSIYQPATGYQYVTNTPAISYQGRDYVLSVVKK